MSFCFRKMPQSQEFVSWWEAACLCFLLCGLIFSQRYTFDLECFHETLKVTLRQEVPVFPKYPLSLLFLFFSLSLAFLLGKTLLQFRPIFHHTGEREFVTGEWGQENPCFSLVHMLCSHNTDVVQEDPRGLVPHWALPHFLTAQNGWWRHLAAWGLRCMFLLTETCALE